MTPRTAIQALRLTAFIEGLSWLALLGTLIYRASTGHHDPVAWAGRVHGGLFCLFSLSLLFAWIKARWTLTFTALIALSAFIPTGFLFADPFLGRKLRQLPPPDHKE